MDNSTLMVIVLVVLAIAVVIAGWAIVQRNRSRKLKERFGPEYEHTVNEYGNTRQAEADLAERAKRVSKFDIRALSSEQRDSFGRAWQAIQARFVDEPSQAVRDADQLINEVMTARGYPMGDFDQRAADISVDHPQVVSNYRAARDIATSNRNGQANTEDLRQAMIRYRSLFAELLEDKGMMRTDQPMREKKEEKKKEEREEAKEKEKEKELVR
jgi:hypothetical protein